MGKDRGPDAETHEQPQISLREPKVGDKIIPAATSLLGIETALNQAVQNLQPDVFTATEIRQDTESYVVFRGSKREDQSSLPHGSKSLVITTEKKYDASGLLVASRVERGAKSSAPSTKREFFYSNPDEQGAKTLIRIDDFLYDNGGREVLIKRQTLQDGSTQEDKSTQTVSYPGNESVRDAVGGILSWPKPGGIVDLEGALQSIRGSATQPALVIYADHNNSATLSVCRRESGEFGEQLWIYTIGLGRDKGNRMRVRDIAYTILQGSSDPIDPAATGKIKYTYDRNGRLEEKKYITSDGRNSTTEYYYSLLETDDDSEITIYDLEQTSWNTHPHRTFLGRRRSDDFRDYNFRDEVILGLPFSPVASLRARSIFDIGMMDQVVGPDGNHVNCYIIDPQGRSVNPKAEEIARQTDEKERKLIRVISLPSGDTVEVTLQLSLSQDEEGNNIWGIDSSVPLFIKKSVSN